MKLTDENLDYMDCRPLGRDTGIKNPEWLEDLIKAAKNKPQAEMAKSGKPSNADDSGEPGRE
jgi:hypothetical protein